MHSDSHWEYKELNKTDTVFILEVPSGLTEAVDRKQIKAVRYWTMIVLGAMKVNYRMIWTEKDSSERWHLGWDDKNKNHNS